MSKFIEGGVCAPKGFKAGGLHCGLAKKADKFDLGLLLADCGCKGAAVYTTNKVKGAPIAVTKRHMEGQTAGEGLRGIIINSGNANTCNADGEAKALQMTALAGEATGINKEAFLVASTGVIGQVLPIEPIKNHIKALAESLSYDGGDACARAIMTTDTYKKEFALELELEGKKCRIGGMAKGSGMIEPNMATMLCFITTDADISLELLDSALKEAVKVSFNRVSVDGDTSTNDMCSILASGLGGNSPITQKDSDSYKTFAQELTLLMTTLAKEIARDGEGATKLIECRCGGAPTEEIAEIASKSVINSPLVKSAMFGEDANCGRVLCALGYAKVDFPVDKVAVSLKSKAGSIMVCEKGNGLKFDEDKAAEILKEAEITIDVDLGLGDKEVTCWGCDLTYDYVKINGDYRS